MTVGGAVGRPRPPGRDADRQRPGRDRTAAPGQVTVIVPAGVDDPRRPSGGNRYDRRACDGLRRLGWTVCEREVPGAWPHPDAAARTELAAGLADAAGIVLVDGLVGVGAPDLVARAARTVPVVVLAHMGFGDTDPSLRAGEGRLLSQVAGVVTTSRWTRQRLLDAYGLAPAHVAVATPGVDPAPALSTPSPEGGRLLCVAAVTSAKGHGVLLAALRAVVDRPWQCRCVGALDVDPVFAAQQQTDAARLGDGRVRFTGPLGGADLDAAYAAADLLVLPSRTESWGLVITEALARGVPVLASDVGGIPEALAEGATGEGVTRTRGRPGLLVPPSDPVALTGALDDWLTDAGLRGRLQATARDIAPRLPGWERTATTLAGVLTRLAMPPGGAAHQVARVGPDTTAGAAR